jgi:hypothetical protein
MRASARATLIGVSVLFLALASIGCGGTSDKPDGGGGGTTGNGGTTGTGGTTGNGGTTGTGGVVGSGTCGRTQPCGGNIMGSWRLTEDCVDLAPLQPTAMQICAQAAITSATASISGTINFNADATFSVSQTGTATLRWSIPSTCTGGMTCTAFGAAIMASLPSGQSFSCTGTTTCTCTQGANVANSSSGTYGTNGSNLTITSSTGTTATGSYCVEGTRLHLITLDSTASNGIGEDVVAEKI